MLDLDAYQADLAWQLHGKHEAVRLNPPAAGAALTYTIPVSVQQTVVAASFTYTASNNAANRFPRIRFLDQSGTAFCDVCLPYKLVATNVSVVTFGINLSQFGADSQATMGAGIPEMRLEDGLRVQLTALNIDVADTITAARLFVNQVRVGIQGE